MNDQIILRFLKAGLINVAGDDAKLARLQETAADLAVALKSTPSKAASFALIAFDPDAPTDDPVIKEAIDALQNRWATYMNTFSGIPVAVLRAVLLDALFRAASEDDKIGVAFVTSARNALPFMEAANERTIWADVVETIEQRVDARAEAEWATPEKISIPTMTFDNRATIKVSTSHPSINKEALLKKIEAATGPQNAANEPTNGNSHWPNNPQVWARQFATRMTDTLTEALEAVAKGSEIKPVDLSGPLKELAQAVSAHVDETLKAVSGATAGLQRRTNLIWWKQTLYSPSAHVSYRSMAAPIAAAMMAFDLHRQVPTFSPASVAAFLHEAVLSLPSIDCQKSQPIRDFLVAASNADELKLLREVAAELIPEPVGRGPLLGLIGKGPGQSPVNDESFRRQVGVPATTMLTVPAWATWIFRELQAARAAQEGIGVKKRGRKS